MEHVFIILMDKISGKLFYSACLFHFLSRKKRDCLQSLQRTDTISSLFKFIYLFIFFLMNLSEIVSEYLKEVCAIGSSAHWMAWVKRCNNVMEDPGDSRQDNAASWEDFMLLN